MRKIIFSGSLFAALCGARAAGAPVPAPTLNLRFAAHDRAAKSGTEPEWIAAIAAEVSAAVKDGADALVFPAGFSAGRRIDAALAAAKAAAGPDRLIVFGHAPHRDPGEEYATSRAYVYTGGEWAALDGLDPTPAERAAKPPVRAGQRLILFRFRGGLAAVLPGYSIEKPEIAVSLKKRGVQLVIVCATSEDELGRARLERTASARAVELGAAVVISYPSDGPIVSLPAQTGFELKPTSSPGRDVRIPWKNLLDLRSPPAGATEARPFLDPSPYYQVEI